MLKVFFFYLVTWWFVKLENKKTLTARSVFAGILAACSLAIAIGMIYLYAETGEAVVVLLAIVEFVLFFLFLIRSLCDISKIRDTSASSEAKGQRSSIQNTGKEPKRWL